MSERPVTVGVTGLGYWGPNLARNFDLLPGADLRWLCDRDGALREKVGAAHPDARRASDLDELLADPELDAVVLATPVPTHADLAVIVTAHPDVDHEDVARRAALTLDLRGVTRGTNAPNVHRL